MSEKNTKMISEVKSGYLVLGSRVLLELVDVVGFGLRWLDVVGIGLILLDLFGSFVIVGFG